MATPRRLDLDVRLCRAFRVRDEASATTVSFIAGTAVFIVATSVLLNFVVESPGVDQGLVEQALKVKGSETLQVLLGTPGYPLDWGTSASKINSLNRLGILEPGSTARIDPSKFDAIAKGRFSSSSPTNGVVDYDEARVALGLQGYDFHLRGSPAIAAFTDGSYGVEGMESFRVAYVGAWDGAAETTYSQAERAALDYFPIGFKNSVRTSITGTGDVYKDDSSTLRSLLVPLLGTTPAQTLIPSGTDSDAQFHILNDTAYESVFATSERDALTKALALSTVSGSTTTLTYEKNKEVRVVLGTANMNGLATATLSWNEWVDTGATPDAGDYGWVEASPDGGATWYPLTNTDALRSKESPLGQSDTWTGRQVVVSAANCGPCLTSSEVHVAFHWLADNDNNKGQGWIVDDVKMDPVVTTGFQKTFEKPEYDMLIIGSKVGQNAFTPAEVKYGIRDYVSSYGGRLLVLGGEQNTQWLEPLFGVGVATGSPGVSTPDPTHALLTVPNELDWDGYPTENKVWDFNGGNDEDLFSHVVQDGSSRAVLTVSRPGTFPALDGDGAVMLTTYLPYGMDEDGRLRFFANALTYGRYHGLYLELGPEVPTGIPVASVTRTATMDKTKTEEGSFVEMAFILYLWQGNTTIAASTGAPSAPQNLGAVPGNGSVSLSWVRPLYTGSTPTLTNYVIYKGTASGQATYNATLGDVTSTVVTGLTNGVTYYFNLTAVNSLGLQGLSSTQVSVTPSTAPSKPLAPAAVGVPGAVQVSWSAPWSNGGLPVSSYYVERNATDSSTAFEPANETSTTTFTDTNVKLGVTYLYRIYANNSVGTSPASDVVSSAPLAGTPGVPVGLSATGGVRAITLSWTPAADPSLLTKYNIYHGSSPNPTTFLAEANKTDASWIDANGLTNGQTKYYRITAVNANGESAYSNEASATTLLLPTSPLLPSAAPGPTGSAGPGNLTVTWTRPADLGGGTLQSYKVYAGDSSGAVTYVATVAYNGSLQQEWMETGLGNARTRYYAVSAVTTVGESPLSSETNGTTWTLPNAPSFVATPAVGPKVTLVITDPLQTGGGSVLTFKIYRCTATADANCAPTFLTETGGNQTWEDRNVEASTITTTVKYRYVVSAVTAAGEGTKTDPPQTVAMLIG